MDLYEAVTDNSDVERFTVRNVFRPGVLVKVYLRRDQDVYRFGRVLNASLVVEPDPNEGSNDQGVYPGMVLTLSYTIQGVDDEGEDDGQLWTDWDGDLVTNL